MSLIALIGFVICVLFVATAAAACAFHLTLQRIANALEKIAQQKGQ
ncbi:hypothetical protein [Delftia sp. ZNC0008]|nr:hypothetical protein [Delftia sp. ZNC0008]